MAIGQDVKTNDVTMLNFPTRHATDYCTPDL